MTTANRPVLTAVPANAKPRAPKRKASPTVRAARTGIVGQVQTALKAENRLATFLGALLGAIVPVATFTVAHSLTSWRELMALLVVGGLLYSGTTVYQWGRLAFGSWYKALGFTVLLEGVMTFSHGWLSGTALGYLVAINAIATGATLALGAPKRPVNDTEF